MKPYIKAVFIAIPLFLLARFANAQCGLMLVSGNDTGYSPNVQSTALAANDVAYTWANSSPAANQFAIFQTHNPWGSTIVETAITNAGYTYTVFAPAALTGFNFAVYSVVILNFDDTSAAAFNPPYAAEIPALQTYVQGGGVLWMQTGIQNLGGATTYPLPFGGTATWDLETNDFIDNTGSPLVAGVANPMVGNYASHANFTGYPASSQVVVTTGTAPGGPTVLYTYQTGLCPPTNTPTITATTNNTPTITPTATSTNTPTVTMTSTFTNTPTITDTLTATNSPTITDTLTVTSTSTSTPTITATSTPTQTATVTPTLTPTLTYTPTCVTYVWPDPYNPKTAVGNSLRISCMNAQSTVAIYSISGELIQTLDQSTACQVPDMWGMVYCWNGRNKKGYPVSTGIYIYVVEENNKVIQRGKFLMLNGS